MIQALYFLVFSGQLSCTCCLLECIFFLSMTWVITFYLPCTVTVPFLCYRLVPTFIICRLCLCVRFGLQFLLPSDSLLNVYFSCRRGSYCTQQMYFLLVPSINAFRNLSFQMLIFTFCTYISCTWGFYGIMNFVYYALRYICKNNANGQ